ncbi:hypothetical protein HK099_006094 [Clydaea vesicula]|uniref:non-specific serine/threonine protein kinase n=1 Tax=Clydaea vesicula TaxID=447962 RepID=A0AAD5XZA3_9FUNG|nr:hypothetical protein HK099_006094 [Clydaea vesicula]KAJ3380252.1 hypothetical protein HDU92_006084 [Lobulomyces angularis]
MSQILGKLFVKIVDAKNLQCTSNAPKPYCVVEFEKSEFVTREPIDLTHDVNQNNEVTYASVWKHDANFDVSRKGSELTISIWDRAINNSDPSLSFIGMIKVRPPTINGKLYDNRFKLTPADRVKGDIRVQLMFQTVTSSSLSVDDFVFLKLLGKGSFGKVLQVRKKDTGRIYAMKILVKRDIVERQEIQHTISERNVLVQASSPFLVSLKFSFQTPEKLYLVLDYINGGELFFHLQKESSFTISRAKFYTQELIAAISHLHLNNIVYRDLKPENILLDSTGHICLVDFGLSKENIKFDDKTHTFAGTAEYLAPEVLAGQGYNKAVDWWALGILFYEMTTGLPPFYSENTNLMYNRILTSPLTFPDNNPDFTDAAKSLCLGLLERDPRRRLGGGIEDADEIKRHVFFDGVDWEKVNSKRYTPPFKPHVESSEDTRNISPEFTNTMPVDTPSQDAPISETLQKNFEGFSYIGNQTYSAESFSRSQFGSYGGSLGGGNGHGDGSYGGSPMKF